MIPKTTTISARIPSDVADMLKKSCEQKGINVSKYLTNMITSPTVNGNSHISSNKLVLNDFESFELPSELKSVLSALGGTGVALIVYKLIKTYMPQDKFEKDTIENIALLSAIASGLGSVIAIDKLLKK